MKSLEPFAVQQIAKHNSCNVPQETSNTAIDHELGLSLAAAVHEDNQKKPALPQKRGYCEHRQQQLRKTHWQVQPMRGVALVSLCWR